MLLMLQNTLNMCQQELSAVSQWFVSSELQKQIIALFPQLWTHPLRTWAVTSGHVGAGEWPAKVFTWNVVQALKPPDWSLNCLKSCHCEVLVKYAQSLSNQRLRVQWKHRPCCHVIDHLQECLSVLFQSDEQSDVGLSAAGERFYLFLHAVCIDGHVPLM